MNAPGPDLPPDVAQRAADTVEFLARLAGGTLIVWGFVARVGKPFVDWRRERLSAAIRTALEPELKVIKELRDRDEDVNHKLMLSLDRQGQVFDELDLFVAVVADLRDRADEVTDLMDHAGFASRDRRRNGERRRQAEEALDALQGLVRSRRRSEDSLRNLAGSGGVHDRDERKEPE